ncbi:BatD family protein [Legionella sp. W05-934-2]|uniref:BatD family protein n=1 Tax=Legionella sp. W05-934-2 TaxID=1198649 RepID=UPI00346333FE
MIKRIIITALLVCFMHIVAANQVQVQVESQSIVADKPFTVTFRVEDPSQQLTPDFSELEKDFTILSTATSTRISIINGQRQAEVVWSVVLQTNQAGKLIIPSINFGPYSSPETALTVGKRSQSASKSLKTDQQKTPVFLQAEVNNKKPYINEAVIYTVKLYRQSGVFINGSYQQQEVENALVVPLNKSQDSTILSDGRAFLVESMTYAIYPNDKGKLIIKAPSLRGTISDIYMRRFDIDANEVSLDVQPIPKSAKNYWLPAKQVTLSQNFSQDTRDLQQGNTVIRTIKLTAVGLPAQLIPEVTLPSGTKAKIYEEKPERDNTASNNQVVGTLTLKVTYLLENAGDIDLPEIIVRWFNTKTRKYETATLPKQQWQVKASPIGNSKQSNTTLGTQSQPKLPKQSTTPAKTMVHQVASNWVIMVVIVSILLFVGIIIKFLTHRQWKKVQSKVVSVSERRLRHQLKLACQKQEAKEAKVALVDWAALYFDNPNIINLSQVSNQIGHLGFSKAIQELNQYLYSPKPGSYWRGDALWQAWEDYCKKRKNSKSKSSQSLSPMFPET